ncbi:MAG: O-antigen ligase family protein [Alphaproteobacteria bacterium]|nr:O-antigen ligase family protein [Alphaproteobacteria bacterium]
MTLLLPFAHMQDLVPALAPLAAFLVFLWLAVQRGISFPPARYVIPAALVVIYVVVLAAFQNLDLLSNPVRFVAQDAQIVYMMVFFIMFSLIPADPKLDERIIRLTVVVAICIGLFTMATYITGPFKIGDKPIGHIIVGDQGKFATGLLDKNPYAAAMGQILVTLFACRFATGEKFEPLRRNGMWFVIALFLVAAMVLSRSRGYSTGCIASIFMIWLFARGRTGNLGRMARIALAGGFAIVAFAFVVQGEIQVVERLTSEENAVRRFALYARALEYIQQSPLVGIGPGAYKHYDLVVQDVLPGLVGQTVFGIRPEAVFIQGELPIGQHTHNWVLQFLVDFGILGTLLYFGFLAYVLRGPALPEANIGVKSDHRSVVLWNHLQSIRLVCFYLLIYFAFAGLTAGYAFVSASGAWMFFFLLGRAAATRGALDFRFTELGAVPKFRRAAFRETAPAFRDPTPAYRRLR